MKDSLWVLKVFVQITAQTTTHSAIHGLDGEYFHSPES